MGEICPRPPPCSLFCFKKAAHLRRRDGATENQLGLSVGWFVLRLSVPPLDVTQQLLNASKLRLPIRSRSEAFLAPTFEMDRWIRRGATPRLDRGCRPVADGPRIRLRCMRVSDLRVRQFTFNIPIIGYVCICPGKVVDLRSRSAFPYGCM